PAWRNRSPSPAAVSLRPPPPTRPRAAPRRLPRAADAPPGAAGGNDKGNLSFALDDPVGPFPWATGPWGPHLTMGTAHEMRNEHAGDSRAARIRRRSWLACYRGSSAARADRTA